MRMENSLEVARCAGRSGASRRSSRIEHRMVSDNCAPRRFKWRVAHLHVFFTRVAQGKWRGAQTQNLYKRNPFSDSGLVLLKAEL
ncbi:hypothetical protein A2U01_0066167 [Trifolium medium]|uniref:Uncharacterized protein n=1 Tax=Trifolium medium TaxID=97028 RepID=A0A392S7W9_9FABA|nr:hypothetical protein [Trifolium medium]